MEALITPFDASASRLRKIRGSIVFGVVLFSLVASLATRTFGFQVAHDTEVQASSTRAVCQHLDRDGIEWTPPAPLLVPAEAPIYLGTNPLASLPLPTHALGDVLYNRPPPLS
jgi:hypothetical protein